ncbi:monofunctional riboflavin biosynthesis protein RIBA 2, chloroplastic isoform X1 [Arabidopsis lyrata subsp. lyrata]|uniref:monofunctional riboflavin biosynthesis protein RIBA 2, chloroplastic isoform X1 n=1 Tax=Arabidopsis lyrata subsp. lyrata TaxID=81972 RepID=UPI000A29A8EB|nr:monofunctional riboflavin biosynthesis protein RIBA 2, chloroplastic isoform X1 [Arabidopsis lyrata subsp. lyrata]|eukprot:XP_020884637.1 monofunctional riboflavin biosynthesis protein RIBA 2, chloroplastic isoform X1 [Arabidopsis lyrata subsp. lyrata]
MASLTLRCDSTHLFPSRFSDVVKRTKPFRTSLVCPRIISKRFIVRMRVISEEGDVFSSSKSNGSSMGVEMQPDLVSFGTLAAEMIPTTMDSPVVEDEEFDLDRPTDGFASIPQAIDDIRLGKMVVVVDDEDRENEGDLIMAASLVTPEAMAFVVKHGTGIVCVSMKGEDLERLELPLMVTRKDNEEKLHTAFTVSVDAKKGTSTGVSARDRAQTILTLASKDSKPEDFNRPGHIFPLRYREGGVLKRAGHTEASVDLTVLAGLEPVSVLCEIVDDDGSMARLPRLRKFAQENNLKIISIADLIRYRRKRERLVEFTAVAPIPTMWGPFRAHCFKSLLDGVEHIAMVKGEIGDGKDILVRVHAECITDDIFGNSSGGKQLAIAMRLIEETGRGVFVYLRGPESKGIDLSHKPRTYNTNSDQAEGVSFPVASREYGIGAQILRDLGVREMKVMTNNPAHYVGLKGYGLSISGKVPLVTP